MNIPANPTALKVETHSNFVDGRQIEAGDGTLLDVHNPATGEVIARIPNSTSADIDRAMKSARAAFESKEWGGMDIRSRARLVNKLADAFEANLDTLYRLETLNNGRPLNETRAQLGRLPDFFRYFAGLALSRRDSVIPVEGDYLNYTLRTPIGVVANCTPFNHPLMIMCKSLAAVLASGCTTVVKPSEYTPLTTLKLAQIFTEAGLPNGVFNVVLGLGQNAGKMLAEHPDINKLVLTGGTEAGRIAGSAAAKVFAHQTMELGGKTPVMVFDDFNIDQAVNYAAFGAFIGAGQTCVCASRHIVQDTIYDEFVEKLLRKTESIRIGDPFDPATQLGPVISAKQRDRVLMYSRFGHEDGARLVTGGIAAEVPGHAGGFFVKPTVFADVRADMRIFQEEVFGPFTSVTPFKDEADALRLANDSPFGLAAAIRPNNVARAPRAASVGPARIF
ncbi:aldehyde dehydrogenase [Tardiphaga sp.]|uniref:aldehyde dehydrogenase n=1 Tax=Tardiphaga sp. TaxID=1926292 RepID=UPI0026004BF4|nr:aldehyde dehydrogenase [Tardiphaga sp.]